MSARHTPGPWVVDRHGCVKGGPLVQYARGSARDQVALATGSDRIGMAERDANARLIAAAPRLLAAAKAVRECVARDCACQPAAPSEPTCAPCELFAALADAEDEP